ncbi:cyclin-K-like [Actinia tenebrosa]|uniref:Cyclin-K-like n=1 Tax=Actinia tenebrosa TaxID=6105 RepID=A0A6P8I4A5_ACTTE|nr:cyclin-K-like [Actinia tenebrosa]
MPNWLFNQEGILRTPSRLDGIDYSTECRYRKEATRFIVDCGNKMGLRYDTMATGAVYFHRFYMIQSFKNFSRWVTGAACLFLAGKVEETPKKCRDIIKTAKTLLTEQQFESFGEDPKEEVMVYERVLLQTIKFDLQVDHPYSCLLKFGKALKGDREKLNKLVQMAWTFINDSLSTTLCLRYKPETIAVAMLALAAKFNNYDLQSATGVQAKHWWTSFAKSVNEGTVSEIIDMMLVLYGGKKKEKEKERILEDTSACSSAASSPSVTYSPPIKKRKPMPSSETKQNNSSESKQAPLPSALPPSITQQSSQSSTQLQVENISPAPPTTTKTPATTLTTEPSRPTQSVDTSFNNSSSSSVPKLPNVTQASVVTVTQYTNSGATYGSTLSSSGVPLVTVGSYMTNLHYPAAQGLHMGTIYTGQAYPTQGLTQPIQYQQSQLQPQPTGFSAPPLQPGGTMYGIPPRSLGSLQNPQNLGMGQSPMRAPLPPMPPNMQPVQHPQGRADFPWPQQFGAPPSQNQGMRGGWMPR